MTNMDNTIREIRELRRMADEIQAEIDSLTDTIKANMTELGVDVLNGLDWKVTWKEVTSTRIDTTAIKNKEPEIAKKYTKITTSKRFLLT